jgi:peroxiredoxin
MSRTPASPQSDPGFEVDIRRGRRAVDSAPADSDATPVAERPTRVLVADDTRKPARGQTQPVVRRNTQQRVLGGVLLVALLIVAGAFAYSWVTAAPPGVLARINGENITTAEVDREILVNRALTALLTGQETTPSRFSTVESLIDRRMRAQDATRAGMSVSDDDVLKFVQNLLEQNGKTLADLDTALQGYGLTRADFVAEQRDVVLINSYIGLKVTANAQSDDDRQSMLNDWVTQLQRTSKIERFGVPDEPIAPRIGATAPDFKLRDTNDKITSESDLHGRPILINFWATWCDPCRAELPLIQSTYARIQKTAPGPGPGLQVLGVSVESDPDIITSFQKEYGLNYPILPDEAGQVKDLYRVGPIPTSFFIDRQGIVRAVVIGTLTQETLDANLKLIP